MASTRRWRILCVVVLLWLVIAWILTSRRLGTGADDIHWSRRLDTYPVPTLLSIPKQTNKVIIPRIQAQPPLEDDQAREIRLSRLHAVRETFQHSWKGYSTHAWLRDEVSPLTGNAKQTFGGWAATLVDALDMLWIMGMEKEFRQATAACESIDFSTTTDDNINVFETTIRYLGGFLAAYEISKEQYPILLLKATEVAELLMSSFDTPNRMPVSRWNWKEYVKGNEQTASTQVIVAELGSLCLEFTKLSLLTGNMKYYDAVQRIGNEFSNSQNGTSLPGAWPTIVNARTPSFSQHHRYSLGGMSDSLYEYLPKQYLMLSGQLQQPRKMYETFIGVAIEHFFWRAMNKDNRDLLISGDVFVHQSTGAAATISYVPRGQHLTCFVGGMVGLASRVFDRPQDMDIAQRLTDGCLWSYNSTESGIGPEVFQFTTCGRHGETPPCSWDEKKWRDALQRQWAPGQAVPELSEQRVEIAIEYHRLMPGMIAIDDPRYMLRPETIESVFIMYRLTGDRKWMDSAWEMFVRIDNHTRTDIAAAALLDVTFEQPEKLESMESFWLAETLKYFYLTFSDWDVVSLDEWIFNTEAHPLRRPDKTS